MVEDGAFSHKIDYVYIFQENLNLQCHLNSFIGSKVTAILLNGGILPGVELHREGSAPAACTAGLFKLCCTILAIIFVIPVSFNLPIR